MCVILLYVYLPTMRSVCEPTSTKVARLETQPRTSIMAEHVLGNTVEHFLRGTNEVREFLCVNES